MQSVRKRARLYVGDALQLMWVMPSKSFDVVITDPTYCMGATPTG